MTEPSAKRQKIHDALELRCRQLEKDAADLKRSIRIMEHAQRRGHNIDEKLAEAGLCRSCKLQVCECATLVMRLIAYLGGTRKESAPVVTYFSMVMNDPQFFALVTMEMDRGTTPASQTFLSGVLVTVLSKADAPELAVKTRIIELLARKGLIESAVKIALAKRQLDVVAWVIEQPWSNLYDCLRCLCDEIHTFHVETQRTDNRCIALVDRVLQRSESGVDRNVMTRAFVQWITCSATLYPELQRVFLSHVHADGTGVDVMTRDERGMTFAEFVDYMTRLRRLRINSIHYHTASVVEMAWDAQRRVTAYHEKLLPWLETALMPSIPRVLVKLVSEYVLKHPDPGPVQIGKRVGVMWVYGPPNTGKTYQLSRLHSRGILSQHFIYSGNSVWLEQQLVNLPTGSVVGVESQFEPPQNIARLLSFMYKTESVGRCIYWWRGNNLQRCFNWTHGSSFFE